MRFFILSLLVIIATTACSPFPRPGTYNTNYYTADTGADPYSIEGTITYNQTVQPGTHVFLVNSSNTLISQITSDYAGYYDFETTEVDTYTILAGYEASAPLMAVVMFTLNETQIDNIVYLELTPVVATEADTGSSGTSSSSSTSTVTTADSCTCEAEVWNFSLTCCDDSDADGEDTADTVDADTAGGSNADDNHDCSWQWGQCTE